MNATLRTNAAPLFVRRREQFCPGDELEAPAGTQLTLTGYDAARKVVTVEVPADLVQHWGPPPPFVE